MSLTNYALKDEIREYWSGRAAGFDLSPGHRIGAGAEHGAWSALLRRHMGGGDGQRVLELAFGTGEVTGVLLDLGCEVTGLDLTEAMLELARAKHRGRERLRLFLGDAEDTREAEGRFDAVVSRHLVWTLVDPERAFRDWFRVLRPGGRVVIADGDYVRPDALGRLRLAVSDWLARRSGGGGRPSIDQDTHQSILRQVHFRDGLRVETLRPMLEAVGFTDFRVEPPRAVHAAQRKGASLQQKLRIGVWNSFVLSCAKPMSD